MSRTIFVLAILGLFLLPITASANFQVGDKEVTLSGSGSSDNDLDYTTFAADFGFGYFYSEHFEAVLRQNVAVADTPGDSDWNGSTRIGADFNFDLQNWRPFVGATIGYLYGDSVNESFIAGPEVGVKTFVNDTTFVLASVGYDFIFDDADEADDAFSDGRFIYNLGLGFRW